MTRMGKVLWAAYMGMCSASVAAVERDSLRYSVLSDDKYLGEIVHLEERSDTEDSKDKVISVSGDLSLSGWWGSWSRKYQIRSRLRNHKPVSLDMKLFKNGKGFYIHGEEYEGQLWVTASEVKSGRQREDEQVVDVSFSILTEFFPELGFLSVFGGEDSDQGIMVPLTSFDVVDEALPDYIHDHDYRFNETAVSVFEPENMEILTYTLTARGEKYIDLAGTRYRCQEVEIHNRDKSSVYWIARKNGQALLVQETGTDKEGHYQVTLMK
ncbi:MAG: hypothetical protein H2067_20185 [Alcanivorax sp.]|nr:hypothetical protein [Alcanivorax sp.]